MTDLLRARALSAADPTLAPYSGAAVGAAVADAEGRWLAAPRIESASFPLTITALQGVWSLASMHRLRPAALRLSRLPTPEETAFVQTVWPGLEPEGDAFGPAPSRLDDTALDLTMSGDLDALAFEAAGSAVVPVSAFRVGAALRDGDGRTVVGANVEHPADWTRGLCAERVALVAAHASGLGPLTAVAVACASAPGGSPCGGCRQLLAEYAAGAEVRIATDAQPRLTTPADLLPGAFVGDALGR